MELFYLTKNRQNVGTNNESGLLDRNSLRTVSIVAFSYFFFCSSFILFLSLSLSFSPLFFLTDSSPPVFPSKTSTTTTVHGGNANYFLVSRPRHAGSTTKRDRRRRAVFPAALLSLAWDFNFTVAANLLFFLLFFYFFFLAGSNRLLSLLVLFFLFFYSHQVGYCRRRSRRRCRCRCHAATGNNWRSCERGRKGSGESFDIFLPWYQSFEGMDNPRDGTNLFAPLEFSFSLSSKFRHGI